MELKCPIDGGNVVKSNGLSCCEVCKTEFHNVDVKGNLIEDFRCVDDRTEILLTFSMPVKTLPTGRVEEFGIATEKEVDCMSRESVRNTYGTKLQKELFYYIDELKATAGLDACILDLGCGNGGNKRFLESLGFRNVISVDYMSSGADYLVDVHRMPFGSESFDMIVTTSTLEHFYNPFIAFKEMSRVLKKNGMLLASGSFWESWHGNSCFHFTPGGLSILCEFSQLKLKDLWVGWGFIPSITSHALGMRRLKWLTYKLQDLFYFIFKLFKGSEKTKRHKFNTAGSFGICAIKSDSNE